MDLQGWTHILIRSVGAVIMLFMLTRILGKKQISQLTFFEYITGITLGELAGFISTDLEAHYMHGITALLVWFTIPLGIELLTLRNRKLRQLLEGKGRTVIDNGKIMEKNLRKERFSIDELLEQLRSKNVFKVADVEFATLEASGELSVLLKREYQQLTPRDIGMNIQSESQPITVIMDGEVIEKQIHAGGKSAEWIYSELDKRGFQLKDVALCQMESDGELYFDLYDDQRDESNPQQMYKVLMATLRKCQGDLELFALTVRGAYAQKKYQFMMKQLEDVIRLLQPISQENQKMRET